MKAGLAGGMSARKPAEQTDLHVQTSVAGAVGILAVLALAGAWYGLPGGATGAEHIPSVVLSICLVIATVGAYQIPLHVGRHTKVYVSSVAYFLLAVLVAPPLAATAAATGSLLGEMSVQQQRGTHATDIITQAGRRTLIVLVASIVGHLPIESAGHALLLIAAALILGIGDIVTFPLVVYRLTGEHPLRIIATSARRAYLVEGAQYLVGVLGALAWGGEFWALALLAGPMALVYLAFRANTQAQEARAAAQQAADALRESEQRYRTLFENASDLVFTLDPDGNFISVNQASEETLGYTAEEILRMNITEIVVPAQLAWVEEMVAGAADESVTVTREFDVVGRDGNHVTLEVSSRPVRQISDVVGIQGIARDVTERRRVEEERARHARELAARVLQAQEEERKRIARELHDETAQSLSVLLTHLDLLEQHIPDDGAQLRSGFKRVGSLARRVLDEIRALSHDLRPTILDDVGLFPALEWLAREYEETYGGSVQLLTDPKLSDSLSANEELALFRIVQEALTNSGKHGSARAVSVSLSLHGSVARLMVKDDGHGFDPLHVPRPSKEGHLGLYGMRERAGLLGGKVEITSSRGQGTRVAAEIPLIESVPAVLPAYRVS